MLKRRIAERIKMHLASNSNKILIVDGARQVGKTWLVDEFGRNEYEHYIKISCDNNPKYVMQDWFIKSTG